MVRRPRRLNALFAVQVQSTNMERSKAGNSGFTASYAGDSLPIIREEFFVTSDRHARSAEP
ncbi:MAG: hypothetical protein AMK74_02655 [Nitrospira bacterium SM23_35]|nr:MAG: hypothetical protein AMK74_02655 [Nitrospira bacterium SM23_35]